MVGEERVREGRGSKKEVREGKVDLPKGEKKKKGIERDGIRD